MFPKRPLGVWVESSKGASLAASRAMQGSTRSASGGGALGRPGRPPRRSGPQIGVIPVRGSLIPGPTTRGGAVAGGIAPRLGVQVPTGWLAYLVGSIDRRQLAAFAGRRRPCLPAVGYVA